MISLYQYLVEEKNYTEAEAEETVLKYEMAQEIPKEIKKDIKEYWGKVSERGVDEEFGTSYAPTGIARSKSL